MAWRQPWSRDTAVSWHPFGRYVLLRSGTSGAAPALQAWLVQPATRLLAILATVCILIGTPASAQDTAESRMAAAQRYDAVASFDDLMEKTAEQVAQSLPQEQRDAFIQTMNSMLDAKRLRQFYFRQLTATFTTAELDALAEFYGSTEGQSIILKFPKFMAVVLPVIQQEVRRAASQVR